MNRSDHFYEIPHLQEYRRSSYSDSDLINKKRITNKPAFISQQVLDILPDNEDERNAFFNRIEDKVHSLWVHNQYSEYFYDILYFDEMKEFTIYKEEFGAVVLLRDEPASPSHLCYYAEDEE